MTRTAVVPSMIVCLASVAISASCQEGSDGAPRGVTFVEAGGYGDAPTFQVALGDLDGDGDLDAVFANMHAESEVWLNDGSGRFTDSGQRLGAEAHGVGIGDLDGDGDVDLLLTRASSTAPSSVYLNDGSGRFTPARGDLGDRGEAANCVSLFDLEGDGDLDAAVYYARRYEIVYVNDGTGQFAAVSPAIPGMAAWGDLDGDGDVDAVVQRFEGGYLTLRNAGEGVFAEAGLIDGSLEFGPPGSATLGDIDNDGDLDFVDADGGLSPDTPLTILRNDGAGSFSLVAEQRFLTSLGRIALGDFNGDGALDVLIHWHDRPDPIGLNDGAGGFIDSGVRLGNGDWEGVSALGDLDGDGDLDIFVARYGAGGPNTVWLNQAR
jgi:hypothetical protein